MSKYVVYKSIDKLPIMLKTKGKVIWDKGIIYGINKTKQDELRKNINYYRSLGTN